MSRLFLLSTFVLSSSLLGCQQAASERGIKDTHTQTSRVVSGEVTEDLRSFIGVIDPTVGPGPVKASEWTVAPSVLIGTGERETGEEYLDPILHADSLGTLTVGETVTMSLDLGGARAYHIQWHLDEAETVDSGYGIQQARWSQPGTYTVEAEVDLEDGSSWIIPMTFTVLDLTLDIGLTTCEDGSRGMLLTLNGTHFGTQYGIYGTTNFETWTALDTNIFGEDGSTYWDTCDLLSGSPTYFFSGAVEDNPDHDEWTTGEEQFISETDPWTYEEGYNCLLVEDDGSWQSYRTSAEVCNDYLGAVCSGFTSLIEVEVGGEGTSLPSRGATLPDGWAADADANGTKSTGIDTGTNPWKEHVHDCDDFAREFEDAIELDGHEATITIVFEFDRKTCTKFADKGHALNDFHDADGRIGFWEPQTNQVVDLDLNKDGVVDLAKRGEGTFRPTEQGADGRCIAVETFDDFDDTLTVYKLDP